MIYNSLGPRIMATTKMSLISLSSGNFHQLSRKFGSCFELLKFHTRSTRGLSTEARRLSSRMLKSYFQGRLQKPEITKPFSVTTALPDGYAGPTANMSVAESGHHEVQGLDYYDSMQTIIENRISGWPYVFIVFDLETTGLSSHYERIIEIAARDLRGGKNSTFESLVNPGMDVPERSTRVNMISTDMVNSPEVPRFEELAPIFLQFVRSRQIDGRQVIMLAHNAKRFDVPFLVKEFHQCSVEIPSDWLFMDTLHLANQLVLPNGSKLPSISMGALRERYSIPLAGQAHRAMEDVRVLCEIFQRLTFELKMPISELVKYALPFPKFEEPQPTIVTRSQVSNVYRKTVCI